MKSALITGATAGIGAEYSRFLAEKGYNLILVARDRKRLNETAKELSKRYNVKTEVLVADLSVPSQLKKVEQRVQDSKKPISILVNNAGFGLNRAFSQSKLSDEADLLAVLVTAPMRLTHAALVPMTAANSGTIINISSVASWIAGGTYSAAKSYLTVLSESLHTELKNTKVKIIAVCPGFTHTEFHQRGKMKMTGLPKFMWLTTKQVVEKSWADLNSGKAISVAGWQYKLLSFVARYAPRSIVRKVGMNVRRKQRS